MDLQQLPTPTTMYENSVKETFAVKENDFKQVLQ